MNIFDLCPRPDDGWRVDWDAADRRYAWIRALRGCPQSPVHHGEGDVWIHTRMVCEAMAAREDWRRLPTGLREDLFAAALLHDAAKPECTKVQSRERVTSRGHARRGAFLARRVLWGEGAAITRRERVCSLVRHHMVPLYLRDSERRGRQVRTISQSLRCDLLAILGRADAEGRICENPVDLVARHHAYADICRALDCFDRPYEFASEHGRFLYLRHVTENPEATKTANGPEVTLVSHAPGAGARAWLQARYPDRPILDVEAIRDELGVSWRDNQGSVIALARDRARELLARGRSFAWLDWNRSRSLRDQHVGLLAEHDARVHIVHFEIPRPRVLEALEASGRDAEDLERLLERWEVPGAAEAHRVTWVEVDGEHEATIDADVVATAGPVGGTAIEPEPVLAGSIGVQDAGSASIA